MHDQTQVERQESPRRPERRSPADRPVLDEHLLRQRGRTGDVRRHRATGAMFILTPSQNGFFLSSNFI